MTLHRWGLCTACGSTTLHAPHLAGWRCTECSHCHEQRQAALGEWSD